MPLIKKRILREIGILGFHFSRLFRNCVSYPYAIKKSPFNQCNQLYLKSFLPRQIAEKSNNFLQVFCRHPK
jgi:hypothetical protein